MAPSSQIRTDRASQTPLARVSENAASIVLPVEQFTNVARLVTAGFLSDQLFGIDAVDDLQLAIELVLSTFPVHGTHVSIVLASDEEGVTVTIGTFEAQPVEQYLRKIVCEGLDLRAYLGSLVDSVVALEGAAPRLSLRKNLPAPAV